MLIDSNSNTGSNRDEKLKNLAGLTCPPNLT
jgi:hypothetical protein